MSGMMTLMRLIGFLGLCGALGAAERTVFQEGRNGYGGTFDRVVLGDETAVDGSAVETYTLDGDPAVSGVEEDKALLIRFDGLFGSASGQVPTGATILTAKLVLSTESALNNGSSPSLGPWVVGQLQQAVDGTTNYSDLSAAGLPGPRGAVARPVAAGFVDIKSGEEVAADVTAILRAWQGGASNHGLAVYSSFSTDSWVLFASGSSEVRVRPRLEVEFVTEATTTRTFGATRSALLDSTDGDATLDGSLLVDGAPLDDETDDFREALFAFDGLFGSGAGQIPAGEVIVKAEMVLTTRQFAEEANFGADSLDFFGVFPMKVTWDLDDDNDDNEPDLDFGEFGPTIANGDIDCAVAEFGGLGQDSAGTVDLTQLVREWQGGRANHGVNVKLNSGFADSWYLTWPGTTGPDGPRLVVTTVSAPLASEEGFVEFRDGVNGYEDTFQMRVDLGGGQRFPEDFMQYGLDGYPTDDSPEDASDLLRFGSLLGSGANQIPTGATILSAQLEYSTSGATSSAATGGPYSIGQLNKAVDASTVYADLSGAGDGSEGVRGSISQRVGGYSRVMAGQRVGAEVSSIVQDWVDGTANEGFGVFSSFSSDEWIVGTRCDILERRPALKVRYTTSPTETIGAVANVIALLGQEDDATEDGSTVGFAKVDADDGFQFQTLLKFENLMGTESGQLQAGDEVLQAWLIVNTGDQTGDDSWGPVELRRMTTPWSLTTTWTDFGADGPSEQDGETGEVMGEFYGMGLLTECRLDVTEVVKDWQVSGMGEGLILQARTGDSWWMEMPGSDPFRAPRILVTIATVSGFADWAAAEGLPNLTQDDDGDGDGYDALVEYGLGLDPDAFDEAVVLQKDGSDFELVFVKGEDAKTDEVLNYEIQWSDDLQNWTKDSAAVDGADEIKLTVTPSQKRFYRLVVSEG